MHLDDLRFSELLEAIAAKAPTPGGGAVASMTLATVAALGQMVVNYSIGKKTLALHEALHQRALGELQSIRSQALTLAELDGAAYARLNELLKLKEDHARRQRELPNAVIDAVHPPSEVLRLSLSALELLNELCGKTNAMLASDLAIAAILGEAAARSAELNIRINLPLLQDKRHAADLKIKADLSVAVASKLARQIQQHCPVKA